MKVKSLYFELIACFFFSFPFFGAAQSSSYNGFELDDLLIPKKEILQGGPPRDGIPAIDYPKFVKPAEADFLNGDEYVLGVAINGIAKAYPIKIMDYHEIVNDQFIDQAIVVTYCPLCGSGMAFSAEFDGNRKTFGVSGMLYNSDVLLYDRQTESLWSQIIGKAVAGPESGTKLELLPTSFTTLREWIGRHPNTLILSTDTGHARDYDRVAYANYKRTPTLMFPVSEKSDRLDNKAKVLGLEVNGKFKAYPLAELKKAKTMITDRFNGEELNVHYDKKAGSARITDAEGREVPAVTLYWFAWYAFHPDTEVFDLKNPQR